MNFFPGQIRFHSIFLNLSISNRNRSIFTHLDSAWVFRTRNIRKWVLFFKKVPSTKLNSPRPSQEIIPKALRAEILQGTIICVFDCPFEDPGNSLWSIYDAINIYKLCCYQLLLYIILLSNIMPWMEAVSPSYWLQPWRFWRPATRHLLPHRGVRRRETGRPCSKGPNQGPGLKRGAWWFLKRVKEMTRHRK